jgi:hypothetical protein
MDRLDSYCRLLPALWRGEKVTEATTGLREASLGPLGIEPPPIYVGGNTRRGGRSDVRGWGRRVTTRPPSVPHGTIVPCRFTPSL